MIARWNHARILPGGLEAAFVLLLLVSSNCWALSISPPRSYERIAGADDEYRLVMLVPSVPLYSNDGEAYSVSGMYKNDGSVELLWQIEYLGNSVLITQDGRYLANLTYSTYSLDDMAVTFYDRGKLIKSLKVSEFIIPSDEPDPGMAGYAWNLEVAFDDKRGLLRITTLGRDLLYFSMATGQLVEAPGP